MEPYVEEPCRRLLMRVTTPALPYRRLANLYRGASHPCAYCYSTGVHQPRGHGGMGDFEGRVTVKPNAAEVLRDELAAQGSEGGVVGLGAAYDPYGPAELKYKLTQRALAVLLATRQPASIVTSSALLLRDLPLLAELAEGAGLQVVVTLCSLEESMWRHVEPEAGTPAARLTAIERLSAAGVPVGVALAPILPEFTDRPEDLAALVGAATEHGARFLASNVPHMEHGGVEWNLPGIRSLHPHLPAQHLRRYRGAYPAHHYTHAVLRQVEQLRQAHGLAEGVHLVRALPTTRGQIALGL